METGRGENILRMGTPPSLQLSLIRFFNVEKEAQSAEHIYIKLNLVYTFMGCICTYYCT
jgi:hypothetical protein